MSTVARGKSIPFVHVMNAVRAGAHLLVLTAGVALLLTQKLSPSSVILISGTIAAWFFGREASRGKFWEIASFVYLLFFFFDLFRISRGLAPSLVHLFIFILINKLFNLQGIRDYYQLFLLTFLTVLAASSLSVEIEMFYLIGFYIVLLIWNLVSITLFFEWKGQEGSGSFPFSFFSPAYFLLVTAAGAATFIIAMGIFFIIPRMQLGYFGNLKTQKTQHVSGFSQKVNLGDIARIDENEGAAMRVRVSGDKTRFPKRFYWRGIAFDHYDGKSWSTANSGTRFLHEDSGGTFYNVSSSGLQQDQLIRQEFYMEPLDTRVIFGEDRIIKVRGNFGAVTRDSNGTLIGANRPESYDLYSRSGFGLHQRTPGAGEIPEHITKYYLQLPGRSAEMDRLTRKIVGNTQAAKDRVNAVIRYLQTNYRYSTTDLPHAKTDPIAEFLFQKKSGHCEYFATSMVLMLRYLNIPARLVNGFLEGEYNDLGDFYLVRQSDAHSWVEVYLDGSWVPFDPSPLPKEVSGSFGSFFNIRKLLDSIQFFWDRYVLIFSAQDQIDAVSSVRDEYRKLGSRMKETYSMAPEFLLFLERTWKKYRMLFGLAVGLIGMMLFALRFFWQRRRRHQISTTPILFYQEMLSILERNGYSRAPSSTPAEFLESIGMSLPTEVKPDVVRLTELFYRARFGNYPLSDDERGHVETSLHHLQQMQ